MVTRKKNVKVKKVESEENPEAGKNPYNLEKIFNLAKCLAR